MGWKAGDVLGGRVLRERIGGGPESELWRADGDVALRFFLGGRPATAVDVLLSLDHPNLARAFEIETEGAHPRLAREWAPGTSAEGRPLTRDEAEQVLLALAYLHGRGVAHGRLTASNVVGREGRVKVTDAGLVEGEAAADLRALGALLPPGDSWGERLRSGAFASADEALRGRPAEERRRMPSWFAGPVLIVGVFLIAYVAAGMTFAGLQAPLRLLAGAAGAALAAVAWRNVEGPLAAALFWGALFWAYGARATPRFALIAGALALAAAVAWLRSARLRA